MKSQLRDIIGLEVSSESIEEPKKSFEGLTVSEIDKILIRQAREDRERRIQRRDYETAREKGYPTSFARYYLQSHVPYEEYEGKKYDPYELYKKRDQGFSAQEFAKGYYRASGIQAVRRENSPWMKHVRATAAIMRQERIDNPNKKFRRGDLFREASRTYRERKFKTIKGRYITPQYFIPEMSHSIGGLATKYGGSKVELPKPIFIQKGASYE